MEPLLDRIDAYCDAVPRSSARIEEFRLPARLVPNPDGLPFYKRPRRDAPMPGTPRIAEPA